MAADEKWYFTKEQLLNSPSRKSGYDVDKELSCRQQAANFIQDMGQRLQVSQLCINTAIVYMHRFYVFHSLASFHRNAMAAAALFLAAKVEEQPRKLEHVIKVAHMCLHRENPNLDTKSEFYLEQAQDLVFNENVLLQTLGFDVAIDHPHTHVVKCCQLVRASKDLAQTSYFMASNSLHLTTMCLQYKPTVVACFCIHLACKWSNWEIPRSHEGKDWFWYVDKTVTLDLLEQLTAEFLVIFDKCPTKLKRKMMSMNQNNSPGFTQQPLPHDGMQFDEPRKLTGPEGIKPPEGLFPLKVTSQSSADKPNSSSAPPPSHTHHQKIDYREYREKKERERMEREKQQLQPQQQRDSHSNLSSSNHHHSKGNAMPSKSHPNLQSRSSSNSSASSSHKSYQQAPHLMQQNVHFQNMKENRDSNMQSSQFSNSMKDSNYLKQHPPHGERESKEIAFVGQYSQNYPNYSHRSSSQSLHSQNNQRDFSTSRENAKESAETQKDSISSSIRDIISQTVSQKELHSMTNERKDQMGREKSRLGYLHGNSADFRQDVVKNGREHAGKAFHDSAERRAEDFSKKLIKKEPEEPVIDNRNLEPISITDKNDETDAVEWSYDYRSNAVNVKTEKKDSNPRIEQNAIKIEPNSIKMEPSEVRTDQIADSISSNKQSMKIFDPKYKSHHFQVKSGDAQIKSEKPGSNDLHKKTNDGMHKKLHEIERIEGSHNLNDVSKHKTKEMSDKHKMSAPGQHQAQSDQRLKESPSKYQKMKNVSRPQSLRPVKTEGSENSFECENSFESEKLEKPVGLSSLGTFQKPQKNHEFGAPGSLSSTLPDSNLIKTKTSSIFSPDSKIPPQNILSTLEKDKKSNSGTKSSSKTPPSASNSTKKTVPTSGSLFSPPLPKTIPAVTSQRHRTSSSGSEPELIPVLTKLEETPGYENIIRERKIALTPTEPEKKPEEANKLFDVDLKVKSSDIVKTKPESAIKPKEIRSDVGAVIYPSSQKSNLTKPNQGFSLAESKFSLGNNSLSTVNLLGIEKMVDTSISPSKQSSSSSYVKPNFQTVEPVPEKSIEDSSKNQEIIDVEGLSHEHKKSEKKKKKDKHKRKEKDRSERKKEKKKHKDKDKERSKDKERHKDKHKDKQREKEIDVVGPDAPIKIKLPLKDIAGDKIPADKIPADKIGIKLKIPKSKLAEESPQTSNSGDLKLKIRKDKIADSRKRERSPKSSNELPQSKVQKTADRKSSSSKPNGTEGSSRNSHKHSVSEDFEFFDLPFFFEEAEENGQGIIKTPDYDFDAHNTSPDVNSHNERETTTLEREDANVPEPEPPQPVAIPSVDSSPKCRIETEPNDAENAKTISLEDCDVLRNYKTILDNHSKRTEPELRKHSVSPISPEDFTNSDEQTQTKKRYETENPNYYNKYFSKKDTTARNRLRDEKRSRLRAEDKRYDARYYDFDNRSRHRREDRSRYYSRDYYRDYYYDRKDSRYDYPNQFIDTDAIGYDVFDVNANANKTASQFVCDASITANNTPDMQYQYGYYSNYVYPNSDYAFYSNMPFMNISLIQQQPVPPGTVEPTGDNLIPPPLPLEPPPDLPPPPETPPPVSK